MEKFDIHILLSIFVNKYYIVSITLMTSSLFCVSHSVQADPSSLGLGINVSDSPYKGYGTTYDPLPHIDYDNGNFFIDDTSLGAYVYNSHNQELSIGLSYLADEFNPKDSDNRQLKQLNKRHSTLVAQLLYSLTTPIGVWSASLSGDVLNESNSILVDINYMFPIFYNKFTFVQTIGINWADGNHNNYYFGVSHRESARSGLPYHHAKSSFTPYISMTASYAITSHANSFIGFRIDQLTGDVKKSPMVANSTVPNVYAGINYQF